MNHYASLTLCYVWYLFYLKNILYKILLSKKSKHQSYQFIWQSLIDYLLHNVILWTYYLRFREFGLHVNSLSLPHIPTKSDTKNMSTIQLWKNLMSPLQAQSDGLHQWFLTVKIFDLFLNSWVTSSLLIYVYLLRLGWGLKVVIHEIFLAQSVLGTLRSQ